MDKNTQDKFTEINEFHGLLLKDSYTLKEGHDKPLPDTYTQIGSSPVNLRIASECLGSVKFKKSDLPLIKDDVFIADFSSHWHGVKYLVELSNIFAFNHVTNVPLFTDDEINELRDVTLFNIDKKRLMNY